jgi:hypothetical protein
MQKDFEVYQSALNYNLQFSNIGTLLLTDLLSLALYAPGSAQGSPLVSISGVINVTFQTVSFPIPNSYVAGAADYEYILFKDYLVNNTVLCYGGLHVKELPLSIISIQSFIDAELSTSPLSLSFVASKTQYWQEFLKDSFVPSIVLPHIESSWPLLGKALIAKLIIYDALQMALRGSLLAFAGFTGSAGGGGNVKKVTTGPADAEFFDASATIEKLFKPQGKDNKTAFQMLGSDICELAGKLRIQLGMCDKLSCNPSNFLIAKPDSYYLSQSMGEGTYPFLNDYYNNIK